MSCTALETELSQLRAQRRDQAALIATMPHNAGWERANELLAQIDVEIATAEVALDECLAEQPQAQDILGSIDRIYCHDASREVGRDEPYLLIATFDMLNVVNAGIVGVKLPTINVVKIGPWQGVKRYETYYPAALPVADRKPFWDLDHEARHIAHPQDVIFIVALMENDRGSPDIIRGVVRDNLLASRVNNTNRAYDAYATTMISNMRAAIDLSRGVVLRDDVIGGVRQLALTTGDLALLNTTVPDRVEKSIRFTSAKANGSVMNDYTVYFSFTV